ncbi:MAG: DUF881 domain-containing protein [Actinomycetes bacterium]
MSHVPQPPRGTSSDAPPAGEVGRRDASMVLLTSLVEDSLDQGYARAAARRAAGEEPSRRGRWVLTAGLLAVGLLLATAAAQTRERASSVARTRAAIATEIEQREADNGRVERLLERQRSAVSQERRSALRVTAEGLRLARSLSSLEVATGAGAVEGPGMVVRLSDAGAADDAADLDARTGTDSEGRVSDRDLQTVVNEVWAAGAEAVAVNEQRLTALSAIRAAGEAILVDFRPLNPPYVIRAVGPPAMRTSFVEGFGGSYLQVLRDYGIDHEVEDDDTLRLPASAGLAVRVADTPPDVRSGESPARSSGELSSGATRERTS